MQAKRQHMSGATFTASNALGGNTPNGASGQPAKAGLTLPPQQPSFGHQTGMSQMRMADLLAEVQTMSTERVMQEANNL